MRLQAQSSAIYVELIMPGTNQIAVINNDFSVDISKLKKLNVCWMHQTVNLFMLSFLILVENRKILVFPFFYLLCTGSLAILKQN